MKTKLIAVLTLFALITTSIAAEAWKTKLRSELPLLGHRNWIVVADSAYPLQTAPGIETIYVDAEQLDVVKGVLAELAKAKHVKPAIYTDSELKFVPEDKVAGIAAYRDGLSKVLAGQPARVLPHEEIIAKLDEAGRTFKVLLIKTKLTKPYTSVFFQLECGYWNEESERELRHTMSLGK